MDEGFEFSVHFCEECGSSIYAVPYGSPVADILVIQVGTLDEVDLLQRKPAVELNVSHRLSWVLPLQGAEQKQNYG